MVCVFSVLLARRPVSTERTPAVRAPRATGVGSARGASPSGWAAVLLPGAQRGLSRPTRAALAVLGSLLKQRPASPLAVAFRIRVLSVCWVTLPVRSWAAVTTEPPRVSHTRPLSSGCLRFGWFSLDVPHWDPRVGGRPRGAVRLLLAGETFWERSRRGDPAWMCGVCPVRPGAALSATGTQLRVGQTDGRCPRSLPLSVPFCGRAYWSFTPSGHASCPHCWCDESVPVLPNGPDKARFGAQAEPGDFSRVRLKARSPAAAREPTRHGGSSVARRCSRSGFTDRGHATLAEQTS